MFEVLPQDRPTHSIGDKQEKTGVHPWGKMGGGGWGLIDCRGICMCSSMCFHCYYRHPVVHRSLTHSIDHSAYNIVHSAAAPSVEGTLFRSFPFLSFPFLPPSLPPFLSSLLSLLFFKNLSVGSLIPLILAFPVLPLLAVLAHVSRGCQSEDYSGDWLEGGW